MKLNRISIVVVAVFLAGVVAASATTVNHLAELSSDFMVRLSSLKAELAAPTPTGRVGPEDLVLTEGAASYNYSAVRDVPDYFVVYSPENPAKARILRMNPRQANSGIMDASPAIFTDIINADQFKFVMTVTPNGLVSSNLIDNQVVYLKIAPSFNWNYPYTQLTWGQSSTYGYSGVDVDTFAHSETVVTNVPADLPIGSADDLITYAIEESMRVDESVTATSMISDSSARTYISILLPRGPYGTVASDITRAISENPLRYAVANVADRITTSLRCYNADDDIMLEAYSNFVLESDKGVEYHPPISALSPQFYLSSGNNGWGVPLPTTNAMSAHFLTYDKNNVAVVDRYLKVDNGKVYFPPYLANLTDLKSVMIVDYFDPNLGVVTSKAYNVGKGQVQKPFSSYYASTPSLPIEIVIATNGYATFTPKLKWAAPVQIINDSDHLSVYAFATNQLGQVEIPSQGSIRMAGSKEWKDFNFTPGDWATFKSGRGIYYLKVKWPTFGATSPGGIIEGK